MKPHAHITTLQMLSSSRTVYSGPQIQLAPTILASYDSDMAPIEFQTELHGDSSLPLPPDVIAQLPKSGHAKVVLLVQEDRSEVEWRRGTYEAFMNDDDPEDAVYDSYP